MSQLPPNLDLLSLPSSAALFSSDPTLHHSPHPTPNPNSTPKSTPNPSDHPPKSTSKSPIPNYTLPQIRLIHTALLSHSASADSRLRTRVGGAYRELLGTADTIVSMRREAEGLVVALGGMGARCGSGVVRGKVGSLRGFVKGDGGGGESRGDRLVLAARLYVLGRLLVKSLADTSGTNTSEKDSNNSSSRVDTARKALEGVHRARLARSIDAVLRSGSDKAMKRGDVLRALEAYSLATSSGARDVLAHLLRVRAKAISDALELEQEEESDDEDTKTPTKTATHPRNPDDVLRALGLYTKTLLDVQTLVPSRLADALLALKQTRLLDDAALRQMEGLRLDIYQRWCGDAIQFFTPFLRHDDLSGEQARAMLFGWAKGSEVVLQGLEKTLASGGAMAEFAGLVDLRTRVLRLWIAEGGRVHGVDSSEMLDRLRDAFNKHMRRVLEAKVAKLRLVGSEVAAALDAGVTDRHRALWDVSSLDTDLSQTVNTTGTGSSSGSGSAAALFTQDVIARLHGRSDAASKAIARYRAWFHVIDDVSRVVEQLRRQRWDDADADGDEIEDETTIEARQRLLSRDDPQALSAYLDRLLRDAFKRLDEQLTALWRAHAATGDDDNSKTRKNGPIAMYLLRILRDIRARLPDFDSNSSSTSPSSSSPPTFGLTAVPSLHAALADTVLDKPLTEFIHVALARTTVVGRALWEAPHTKTGTGTGSEGEKGENQKTRELPTSPSPGVFRFLRDLVREMGDAGGDLWSPSAVGVLRGRLGGRVAGGWMGVLGELNEKEKERNNTPSTEKTEKETKDAEPETKTQTQKQNQDLLVQWLLDIHYLRLFLGPEETTQNLEQAVFQASQLDAASRTRLAKAARDYFKRTSLLFALLV
ncbi:uncharacterized protein C8A04DRAFT_9916 [Dichotomopilus funicola]|uniref:Conserved oligomeric Golgi complex subunit 1 n=1 Tax=Dichotomopilus funicola TaxID=1934379 RepID=A0AAN6VA22_9PEZI|nr:hypothetical protein C8A04DRAFT_9916 [Dichotomopilus funicola]